MTTQATKRPWILHIDELGSKVFSQEGDLIADLHTSGSWKVDEANALLTIKAVNCHDELVEALREISIYADEAENILRGPVTSQKKADEVRIPLRKAIKRVEQAISKAEISGDL